MTFASCTRSLIWPETPNLCVPAVLSNSLSPDKLTGLSLAPPYVSPCSSSPRKVPFLQPRASARGYYGNLSVTIYWFTKMWRYIEWMQPRGGGAD